MCAAAFSPVLEQSPGSKQETQGAAAGPPEIRAVAGSMFLLIIFLLCRVKTALISVFIPTSVTTVVFYVAICEN